MAAAGPQSRHEGLIARVGTLVRAIQSDDEVVVMAVTRLSRSHRAFAPLAFTVGAFATLVQGLRVLLTNWRLALIQILPAMWIWLAMFDLKVHVLKGKSFNVLRGPVLIPIILAIIAITMACFFLNAVFAFAVIGPRPPEVRPALARARSHARPILISGAIVGALLAWSTTIVPRWSHPWFALSLGIVVGLMMVCYVAVPSRIIGVKPILSRREKLTTSAVGTALSATVCTPPYVLGRIGILMLGSPVLLIPGIFVMIFGFGLQAGATGAVKAIKLSAAITAGSAPVEPAGKTPETAP